MANVGLYSPDQETDRIRDPTSSTLAVVRGVPALRAGAQCVYVWLRRSKRQAVMLSFLSPVERGPGGDPPREGRGGATRPPGRPRLRNRPGGQKRRAAGFPLGCAGGAKTQHHSLANRMPYTPRARPLPKTGSFTYSGKDVGCWISDTFMHIGDNPDLFLTNFWVVTRFRSKKPS